jgi:glucokinase
MYNNDNRIVLTLDAGGTNFVFSALQANRSITRPLVKPSNANNLNASLNGIVNGFKQIAEQLPSSPAAISFAFPGPADYPHGIIGDLGNLPAFRGGVALGPMLEDIFKIPVFINNDGDLFAYGEAIAGMLPEINKTFEKQNIQRKYNNLLGITLGTGFGAGIVHNQKLYLGDNAAGAEIWLSHSALDPNRFAEENISIRAIQRNYEKLNEDNTRINQSPKDIYAIALGTKEGNQEAAKKSFELLGKFLGDVLGNAITLLDCNVVIGGGLSNAYDLFAPAMMAQLKGKLSSTNGSTTNRLEETVYNLEDNKERELFFQNREQKVNVPLTNRKVTYNALKKIGIGRSKHGTSQSVAIGAYAFALDALQ